MVMKVPATLAIPAVLFGLFVFWISGSSGDYIQNLTEQCYRCLCHVATDCNMTRDCVRGYCGPFGISKLYWIDGGNVTLPDDDPERNHAWEDCARSYNCAKRIVEGYIHKYGRDCNGDGVTDCYDYMMVNGNGGPSCYKPLNMTKNGQRFLERYKSCGFDNE